MSELTRQPGTTWYPPIPVGDERLGCAYCDWSCPARYQNQTGPRVEGGRDGYTRLTAHVEAEHYVEHRKAKRAASAKARYDKRKADREGAAR